MQGYDFVMIGVLIGAVAWGAWKGFAWQVASTASMVLSYFVALNFRAPLSQMIKTDPPWNVFVAMLILFLGTSLVVWLCFNFVSQGIEKMKLKEFDRQVGAIVGGVKGVILCVLITLFSMSLLDQQRRQAIINSRSGMYISQLLAKADAIMPREIRQVLAPYVDGLEQNMSANPYYAPPAGYNRGGYTVPNLINSAVNAVEQYQNSQGQNQGSYYGGQAGYNTQPQGGYDQNNYGQQPNLLPPSYDNGQQPYIDPQMADRYRQPIQPIRPSNDRPY
jgi:membrane protein required for colicin V production